MRGKEDYLSVFTEYKTLKLLTKKKRKKLVNGLHAYITQEVSANPTHEQLVAVCHDMLEIFPLLREPNSTVGGMVSVCVSKCILNVTKLFFSLKQDLYYHPDTRKGFLASKFHNKARNDNDSSQLNESIGQDDLSDDQMKEYALFFRNCVAKKQTKELKDKLRESARYRKAMLECYENDFSGILNFYFAMPELVSLYFFLYTFTYEVIMFFLSRFCLTLGFCLIQLTKQLWKLNGKIWSQNCTQYSKLKCQTTSRLSMMLT